MDWNAHYTRPDRHHAPVDGQMIQQAAALPRRRALDVGCGAGGLCFALAEQGWTVDGVDVAHTAIEMARNAARQNGASVTFFEADAATWQPPHGFELVTCHFGVPPDPEARRAIYGMMRRALVPGGTILMKFCEGNVSGVPALSGYDSLRLDELRAGFTGFDVAPPIFSLVPAHRRGPPAQGAKANAEPDPEQWTAVLFAARKPVDA